MMAASTRTVAFSSVEYVVATTGDTWYQPTINTSDSPDYSTAPDKTAAVTQCALNSPEGEELVAS